MNLRSYRLPFLALLMFVIWLFDRAWSGRFRTVRIGAITRQDGDAQIRMVRRLTVQSVLNCSSEKAWQWVQTPRLLAHIAAPLVRFTPVATRLPETYRAHDLYHVKLTSLGIIPLGEHTIEVESIDASRRVIQTREHGNLARTWDHKIAVEPFGPNQTLYTDVLEIEAGYLTLVVLFFARIFFRYRHLRWQALAPFLT